jgi:hypothetical protein
VTEVGVTEEDHFLGGKELRKTERPGLGIGKVLHRTAKSLMLIRASGTVGNDPGSLDDFCKG